MQALNELIDKQRTFHCFNDSGISERDLENLRTNITAVDHKNVKLQVISFIIYDPYSHMYDLNYLFLLFRISSSAPISTLVPTMSI